MTRLTRKGFVAWLRSKKPGERVGRDDDPMECPIDRYMGSFAWLDSEYVPKWAEDFIESVDRGLWGSVTAKRALELLGEKP